MSKQTAEAQVPSFIIGEIAGDEAADFLDVATTNRKCLCSVHALEPKSAIDKLTAYIKYKDISYEQKRGKKWM